MSESLSLFIRSADGGRDGRVDVQVDDISVDGGEVYLDARTARAIGNMLLAQAEVLEPTSPPSTPPLGVYTIDWLPDGGMHRTIVLVKQVADAIDKWGIRGAE